MSSSVSDALELFQIAFFALCVPVAAMCIYMIWRCRLVLNGLARGLTILIFAMVALAILLSVRSLHDLYGFMSADALLVLSSLIAVVKFSAITVLAIDLYYIYRNLPIFMLSLANRKRRENDLETMRSRSERSIGKWSS